MKEETKDFLINIAAEIISIIIVLIIDGFAPALIGTGVYLITDHVWGAGLIGGGTFALVKLNDFPVLEKVKKIFHVSND